MDLETLQLHFNAFRQEDARLSQVLAYGEKLRDCRDESVVKEGCQPRSMEFIENGEVGWSVYFARHKHIKDWLKVCEDELQRRAFNAWWDELEDFAKCTIGGAIRSLTPEEIADVVRRPIKLGLSNADEPTLEREHEPRFKLPDDEEWLSEPDGKQEMRAADEQMPGETSIDFLFRRLFNK